MVQHLLPNLHKSKSTKCSICCTFILWACWQQCSNPLSALHSFAPYRFPYPTWLTPSTPVLLAQIYTSGKLHKDYTVYEDVKSILPIYIHVYPVRPCRDDLCEIIPSLWGAVARHDRSDLFIIACGQSHLFMNMLWSVMISCELSYLAVTVLLVWWCVST